MKSKKENLNASMWVALLVLSSATLSYAFACVTPFAALASIAALTLPRRTGFWLIIAAFALNQIVGYVFLAYPNTGESMMLGMSIGISALLSLFAAHGVAGRLNLDNTMMACITTFLVSFGVYQIALYIFALMLGGAENFSIIIIAGVLAINAIVFSAFLAASWLNRITGFLALPKARIFAVAR